MTKGLDIIGDIHGCGTKLKGLLSDLGYRREGNSGPYRHSERQAIFVGDLIDRGDEQLDVLQTVHAMVTAGAAQMVLGNHEFNALAYATKDPDTPGEYLRDHSEKNIHQHEAFLGQLNEDQQRLYCDWFLTLPLWLDLGDIRVIHACWHPDSISQLEGGLGGATISTVENLASLAKGDLSDAAEIVLKGPELDLKPFGFWYLDNQKTARTKARMKWWSRSGSTLRELAHIPENTALMSKDGPVELPATPLEPSTLGYRYTDEVPVIYGHYWQIGLPHENDDWTSTTACVDFSAIHEGTLVAYQWSGEATIDPSHFVPSDPQLTSMAPSE